ncbi:energy-coupled thiamine transporter ThiT [Spiroplasma endosymbiont of Glossina fuscipes fuscipes]|uniref:energy-coupled thiamine transporter ThiT n=1 Tax=Spiroplasma endosymbiont of Glossina fuscipes fuscipes TaxID=2004463 RepID=UPI003C744FC5
MEQNLIFKCTVKQQRIVLWYNKLTIFIPISLYLAFLITLSVLPLATLSTILHLANDQNFKNISIFFIAICVFGLIFSIIYTISTWLTTYEEYINYKMQFIILNIISLNILNLISNIIIYSYEVKVSDVLFSKVSKRKRFLINLGIWKWKTFDFVIIAMFAAVTLVLAFLETLIPILPHGGSIALKYIPLTIIAFIHSALAGFITGAISALMSLLFISSGFIVSPWSYLLDYFIPMIVPMIAGFMRFKVNNDKKYITYINYIIICFSIISLIYVSQVIVGALIWTTLFPDSVWPGYTNWLYSIVYNFIHNFIFTYPIMQIVIPLALRGLTPVFWQRYLKYEG